MATPLIEMTDIKRYYNEGTDAVTKALDGVNITINQGEFVALMGPSGSGKSTLMHLMGFLDTATGGSYKFKEKDVTAFDDDDRARLRREEVGFVFQAFNLLTKSSVLDNVLLPTMYRGGETTKRISAAKKVIDQVGLSHRLHHLSNQLSGGEKQRTAIARALVNNPSIIFADEPTGNLDTKSGSDVLNILADLHDAGHTIVMVTHEEEAAEFAERIVNMRDGKVLGDNGNHHKRRGTYRK